MLNRAVLHGDLDAAGTEEALPQRLGQQLADGGLEQGNLRVIHLRVVDPCHDGCTLAKRIFVFKSRKRPPLRKVVSGHFSA